MIVAELFYKLGVQGQRQVDTALRGNQTALQNTQKSVQGVSTALRGVQAILAGGVLVRGFQLLAKNAADSQIAAQRLGIVFRNTLPEATKSVDNLRRAFGLSTTEAQQLLATTGDIITGLGGTQSEALELSSAVGDVAGRLRDFAGVPIEQASRAVTQALTGQRRALQTLGIVVSETSLKELAEEQGLVFESLTQIEKAQLTVSDIVRQSGNAYAGAAQGASSLAGTQSRLASSFDELLSTTSEELIPAFTNLLRGVRDIVDGINSLPGPIKAVGAAVGLVIPAFVALNAALGPLGLVIGGVTLAVVGLTTALGKANEVRADGIRKQFEELDIQVQLTSKEFRTFERQAAQLGTALAQSSVGDITAEGYTRLRMSVDSLAESYGLTRDEVIKYLTETGQLNNATEEAISIISQQKSAVEQINAEIRNQEAALMDAAQAAENWWDAFLNNSDTMSIIELRKETESAISVINRLFTDPIQRQEQIISVLEKQRQGIIDISLASGTAHTMNLDNIQERLEASQAVLASLQSEGQETEKVAGGYSRVNAEAAVARSEAAAAAREIEELNTAFTEGLGEASKSVARIQQGVSAVGAVGQQAFANLQSEFEIFRAEAEKVITGIEDSREQALDNIDLLEENGAITAEQAAERRLAAETNADTQIQEERRRIQQEQYKLQVNQFNFNKAIQVANIATNTASAIIKAYAELSTIEAAIFTGFIGGLALLQTGLILAQKPPPPPALQEGGIANPLPGGRLALLAEGGDREAVIPLNDRGISILSQALRQALDRSQATAASGAQRIVINVDGEVLTEFVNERIARGVIDINAN